MKIIDGILVREQNPLGNPGNIGDSCFETSAYGLSILGIGVNMSLAVNSFVTPAGTVRHKDSPWREDDMSTDNELPLYMLLREVKNPNAEFIKAKVIERGYKTGNEKFVSPGYLAELLNSQFLRCLFLVGQVLIFWFPFRWSDSKKWFELSWPHCDGYLQWALTARFAPYIFRKLIRKKTLIEKIKQYYLPEPNSAWLVDAHLDHIDRFF